MAHAHEGLVSCLTGIEAKLEASVGKATASLESFAKHKSRILAIQNGSQRDRQSGAKVTLREGSLRALWSEKARKADDAKKAAPEGAVKAEALRWEVRRLAEAKEKLEGLTRDQQRRIIQLEEALSEMKAAPPRRSNSLSRTASGTSDPGSPSRQARLPAADAAALQAAAEAAKAEAAAVEDARKSAVAERDTARQMLHGIKAMLAQSEALRQSADNSQPIKARSLQRDVDRLQAALARSQAEAAADFRELKAVKAERDLALQTLAEVKSAVAASEAARSATLRELQDAIQREKSSLETKAAEMEARCAGYVGALQRAEREAAANKDCIAALHAAVARLHAQAKAVEAERDAAEKRQTEATEDRRRRTLKALREAEQGRAQLVCDKAAAEHDRAQALAAKEAAEKQVASLNALLDALTSSDASHQSIHTDALSSRSIPNRSVQGKSPPAPGAVASREEATPSSAEAATQTDSAHELRRDDTAQQQQQGQDLEAKGWRQQAQGAHALREELRRSEERLRERDQQLSELRAELLRLKAAAVAAPALAPPPSPEAEDALLESPPETGRCEPAPKGPTTPETAPSEGPSRGADRSAPGSAGSSEMQPPRRRRRPPSLELWSPGTAHPLSPTASGEAPAAAARASAESFASFASARSISPYAASVSSLMARSFPLSDADGDVFEDARSRAASNASSIDIDAYFDAESEVDAPASVYGATTPDRSGALAQMQEKLAAAVARAEELEREREDSARLARLHGRAVETQAAALRAAEASLGRKRADVLAANKARVAAEAALAHSIASRRADDLKVQQIAAELEKSLAEAHGEKQRLDEAAAEQAAQISALQDSCKAAEGRVSELQEELQRVSAQADEMVRSQQAAAEAARCSEAAAREEVKTLELCNEQLLSDEKEWTWDTMQAMEARVDELLRGQAQAATVPADAAQRLCIANLEADLSEARSALAQARTEAAALQQECMQLRHNARMAIRQKGTPPSPDPLNKWLSKSLGKAGSPLASWRRNGANPLPTG